MRSARLRIAIAVFVISSASVSLAQSLGEVARQERERHARVTQHAPLVTNEELKQERILAPAEPPVPVVESSATSSPKSASVSPWELAEQPGFSLGEYARALRREREQREARKAALRQELKPEASPGESERAMTGAGATAVGAGHASRESSSAAAQSKSAPPTARREKRVKKAGAGAANVRIARGDSLWKLARLHLGNGNLWKVLWKANPEIRDPNRIAAGQLITIPHAAYAARQGKSWRAARHASSVSSSATALVPLSPPLKP